MKTFTLAEIVKQIEDDARTYETAASFVYGIMGESFDKLLRTPTAITSACAVGECYVQVAKLANGEFNRVYNYDYIESIRETLVKYVPETTLDFWQEVSSLHYESNRHNDYMSRVEAIVQVANDCGIEV